MLGNSFNAQAGSLQLSLSLHLLMAQSLEVSGDESLGASQVFPRCVHSPTCVSGLLDFQEYAKGFQSPL